MPSFRACWRSAPTVRFICFEIFETGILAFECFRSSACIAFVHAAPLRLIFFFVALAIYPSKFVRRSITHQQINAMPLADQWCTAALERSSTLLVTMFGQCAPPKCVSLVGYLRKA
jgi:hypothetical protein